MTLPGKSGALLAGLAVLAAIGSVIEVIRQAMKIAPLSSFHTRAPDLAEILNALAGERAA